MRSVRRRACPQNPGLLYFSLDQQGDFWRDIKASGTMGFYFPNNYTDLKIEMLALKE